MKSSASGPKCPLATVSWPAATQAVAAGVSLTLGPGGGIPCNGVTKSNHQLGVSTLGVPPVAAVTGRHPTFSAWVISDGLVQVQVTNTDPANALTALAVPVDVVVQAYPLNP